jgi:Tol biopolymer transport system component
MPLSGGTAERITFGANVWPDSKIAWSPDGQQLAFETLRGGKAQVWIATLKTGALRPLAATRMSTATGHLTWAPGSAIAYQSPGHHTLGLVDPVTGDQRFLRVDTDSMGFMMSPQYSPDGKALIFAGGPVNDRALWRLNLQDSTRVKIGSTVVWPRGLSADGRFVYAQVFFGPVIFRFDASKGGAPERLFTVPFREADCTPAGAVMPHAFVCAAFTFESDIWAIDLEPPRRRWLPWW